METISEELISESEREKAREILAQLCAEASASLSEKESKTTARAVYHDAVTAAARELADSLSEESVPIAKEVLSKILKDCAQQAYVESCVLDAVKPVARHGALAAVRRWSEGSAIPKAEEAAKSVFSEEMLNGGLSNLQTLVLSNLRSILQNKIAANPQLSETEREKCVEDYLQDEGKKAALETVSRSITPELRRSAQSAAEKAIAEVASEATEQIARDEALDAARVVAADTAKLEISRLVLAEAQRRAAKMARERLQTGAQEQEEANRVEYCQAEARKIAEEAVQSVTDEIADPSVADLDLNKAKELALSAAMAVAREFSGAYQLTDETETGSVHNKAIAFLIAQVTLGCMIIWFFLLGGADACEPLLKRYLPASIYSTIYFKNQPEPDFSGDNTKKPDLEDLVETKTKGGESLQDEVPSVKPSPNSATQNPKNESSEEDELKSDTTQLEDSSPPNGKADNFSLSPEAETQSPKAKAAAAEKVRPLDKPAAP